ncbi:hypothetical protein E4K10_00520 [Streptomyces sp. T1317-0309]|nr:hypothetical protein E4K10_00520 [Streptomyces sp. T1317-0309]
MINWVCGAPARTSARHSAEDRIEANVGLLCHHPLWTLPNRAHDDRRHYGRRIHASPIRAPGLPDGHRPGCDRHSRRCTVDCRDRRPLVRRFPGARRVRRPARHLHIRGAPIGNSPCFRLRHRISDPAGTQYSRIDRTAHGRRDRPACSTASATSVHRLTAHPLRIPCLASSCAGGWRPLRCVVHPHSVRILIGDVKGKGLPAVEDAAALLGAFRSTARRTPSLSQLMATLDEAVQAHFDEISATDPNAAERFITALLLEIPADGSSVRMINCGHPPRSSSTTARRTPSRRCCPHPRWGSTTRAPPTTPRLCSPWLPAPSCSSTRTVSPKRVTQEATSTNWTPESPHGRVATPATCSATSSTVWPTMWAVKCAWTTMLPSSPCSTTTPSAPQGDSNSRRMWTVTEEGPAQ